MFAFGQVKDADQAIVLNLERAGEAIVPNVGKRAGNGDGDVDSTTSSTAGYRKSAFAPNSKKLKQLTYVIWVTHPLCRTSKWSH